ncbi:aminotransferase class V-fold PLP-dependent enzyme [Brassicibacter mesophilus]|uniref:aminotransferase class V-fold PLP-dependent enzyme n=1 Tax=Brassicibacter mesophilus TaxID=745119 RepID=UPI003D258FC8
MLFKNNYTINNIRRNVVGIDKKIFLRDGKKVNYINFDNAASTPTLSPVLNKVNEFLEWYSSIHRGTGYKSKISTAAYERAREIVSDFFNSDPNKNTVIFVKNTTEAINKLSYRLNLTKDDIVITSLMEHHSNDLPWRNKAKTLHAKVMMDGRLDLEDLESKLKFNRGKVKLVAITGCSNVTGIVNDIHYVASLAHKHDTKILVDGAQLAPHRRINMKGFKDDDYIDFLAISGHKMYAPFGTGALIGPKSVFQKGDPEYVGGGTIISVTQHNCYWTDPPDREEAGSPNVVGAIALAEVIKVLEQIGLDQIKEHEIEMTKYLINKLNQIPNIIIYSKTDKRDFEKIVGVITFNVKDINHALLASMLSYEGGIGVRNGCFCAHPYVHRLLGLSTSEILKLQQDLIFHRLSDIPGLVRVSFGMYNTIQEIDIFVDLLNKICRNSKDIASQYNFNQETGEYTPELLPNKMFSDFLL